MKKKFIITFFLSIFFLGSLIPLYSQSEGQRLSFGVNAGGSKYWGEFTDNQFWLAGDAFSEI